jgi:enamine deaminase RidA (YjgF/YER057c/UK114 family)
MSSVWDTWVASGHTPPRTSAPAVFAKADWKIEAVVIAAA